jgi:hypothetical protein
VPTNLIQYFPDERETLPYRGPDFTLPLAQTFRKKLTSASYAKLSATSPTLLFAAMSSGHGIAGIHTNRGQTHCDQTMVEPNSQYLRFETHLFFMPSGGN